MAQDYYTLEEAAAIVRMSPDDLKQMARKGELRSFQDRGTWRFRVPDIEELARRRGVGSDPDLVLGEAPVPKPTDSPAPRSPGPRSPGPRSPGRKSREAEVFDFDLASDEESIGVGKEFLLEVPGSSRKQGGSKSKADGPKSGEPKSGPKSAGPKSGPRPGDPKSGPKSPGAKSSGPKSPGPRSPAPTPGSDSDVRLVSDGSDDDFHLPLDSDAKLIDDSAPPPQVKQPQRGQSGLGGPTSPSPGKSALKRRTGATPSAPPVDSGVRLVPMDSDSDVRIVGPGSDEASLPLGAAPPPSNADSDIRLEKHQEPRPPSDGGMLTEEINLDEELRKEEAQRKPGSASKLRPKPQAAPGFPSASPFELSEADINLPPESEPLAQSKSPKDSSSDFDLTPASESPSPLDESSSDFDLTPAGESASPIEPSSDEEFHLEMPADEVGLGELPADAGAKRPQSGIRLDKPADSGISLEQGGDGSDEIEFELSLDAESTPKPQSPAAKAPSSAADSDSEFELTLDAEEPKTPAGDSSEFELTLDSEEPKPRGGTALASAKAPSSADSDSEFELTLDDSGGLSPLEQDASPQVKSDSDEKDIFETDFEVPALEEDSGSEAVAMDSGDTGLESSDFDIAVGEDDVPAEEESGSQVMALDEEEEPVAPPTRKGKKKAAAVHAAVGDQEVEAEEDAGFGALGVGGEEEVEAEVEAEVEEEPVARTIVKEKLIPPAPWGVMPVLFMLPCVAVMVVVAMLGFELVQSMNGYKSPGLITRTLTNLFDKK
jgi:hypothetical protein